MNIFRHFIKGLSVGALLLAFFSVITPNTWAQTFSQDAECDCSDYEQTYIEAKAEYEAELNTYAEVLSSSDVPFLLEYLGTGELQADYEAFVQASANLEGCRQRVAENESQCSQTPLTESERNYLLENQGRSALDFYTTVEELTNFFREDLSVPEHQAEVGLDAEMSYEAAIDATIAYLIEAHGLAGIATSTNVSLALKASAEAHVRAQGFEPEADPNAPCPDCDEIQRALNAKKAEKTQKEADLRDAQQRKQNAQDAIDQYDRDLSAGINVACEEVTNYQNVQVSSGQAAGVVMGHHFYCRSEVEVENLLKELEKVRNNHPKRSELEEQRNQADKDIKRLEGEIRVLNKEIADLEQDLADCIREVNARPECQEGAADLPEIPTNFAYVPDDSQTVASIALTNRAQLIAIHTEINARFDAFQDRVNTSGFSDYRQMSQERQRAVEYLTNRIPLFSGEAGGSRFGNEEVLLRAVVAETLYRLAQLGQLEGYDLDIEGVALPSDVSADAWFANSIRAAIKNKVFIPQNGKVRPADVVNYAEILTAIRRFFGLDPIAPETPSFENVDAGHWYTPEFEAMVRAGVLTRAEFGTDLKPWDHPTKGVFAHLLYNLLGDQAAFIQ